MVIFVDPCAFLPPSLSLSLSLSPYTGMHKKVVLGPIIRLNKLLYQPEKAASQCTALLPVMELFCHNSQNPRQAFLCIPVDHQSTFHCHLIFMVMFMQSLVSPSWLCSRTYTFIDFHPGKDGKTTWLNLFAEAIELTPISLNEFTNFMYLII